MQTRTVQTGTAQTHAIPAPVGARVIKALAILTLVLLASIAVGLAVGSQRIHPASLFSDSFSRTLFFRLRLPRVLMGMVIGASLAVTGGALQALFRNPLADPYTLGVSGGGALGASIAIALGWSARIAGIPLVFAVSFAGAATAGRSGAATASPSKIAAPNQNGRRRGARQAAGRGKLCSIG